MLSAGVPPKDSFQSVDFDVERPAFADADHSDIVDSDSDAGVPVAPETQFPNRPQAQERTYNTFEEADAAADAAEAYNNNEDVTRKSVKSAFKVGGGGPVSKPNDGFARVTWTDLASGKTAFGKKENEVVNFSLANKNQDPEDYEEIKNNSAEEMAEAEEGEDEDAPQQYKSKFVRRKTILRQQILDSDDKINFSHIESESSERPKSQHSAGSGLVNGSGEDTDIIQYDDDDGE